MEQGSAEKKLFWNFGYVLKSQISHERSPISNLPGYLIPIDCYCAAGPAGLPRWRSRTALAQELMRQRVRSIYSVFNRGRDIRSCRRLQEACLIASDFTYEVCMFILLFATPLMMQEMDSRLRRCIRLLADIHRDNRAANKASAQEKSWSDD